jgi:hypothetical protein
VAAGHGTEAFASIVMCDSSLGELDRLLVGRQAEDKKRAKARKAAGKQAKPLWEEDGKVRGLLDKYDEEEAEEGMLIDKEGKVEDEKRRRQLSIKQKLAEGAALLGSMASTSNSEQHRLQWL